MPRLAAKTMADRFEIQRLAGAGGMGTVYRARDRVTGDPVALKLLHRVGSIDEERFAREARILAELQHPGIVRYVAHGVTADREHYLALEWLEGEDLAARLARGPLRTEETLLLLCRLSAALSAAHARGVVHRDIKPSNIFLPEGAIEAAKILDFGVARLGLGAWTQSGAETRTGAAIGTPAYMAPEQARGDRWVDARADVFSLGCVVFECVTGRPPFAGEHVMAILAKILLEEAPRLADLRGDVPAALDALVAAMLAKDPAGRPEDAAEVVAIAARIELGGEGAAAAPTGAQREITAGEQRLLTVALIGGGAGPVTTAGARIAGDPETTPTLPAGDGQAGADLDPLRAAAAAFEGQLEVLADGSYLVAIPGSAATDQAAQAARCALALRALLPAETCMALATGWAVAAGDPGAQTARVPLGKVIDRAAALLRAEVEAPPRGPRAIRVDEVTAGLLDDRFEVHAGKAGAEEGASPDREARWLAGERPHAEGARTLLGKPVPFVGRERQLRVLQDALAACMAEPEARVVLVKGPAGAGKSRLRAELLRGLGGKAAPEVWFARGDPMRAGSPFGLLAAAIRGAAGIQDGEPLAERQAKLRARVARRVPPAEQVRVAEFLAEIIGAPFSEEQSGQPVQLRAARADASLMGDQMRRAWEDFVLAECAARPILLVLEDLQWGDLPTVRCVDAALRRAEEAPFMVLGLARPEVDELFPRLWIERNAIELRLGELPRKAAEALVRAVLGPAIDGALVARLVDRAAGNAFFLEELIRATAEGRRARHDGAPEAAGDLPETVLAMLHARLEALDPAARRVLRAASVFGQVFWRGGVAALLGGERRAAELGGWLRVLAGHELIERRAGGRFPGDEEHSFRHALLRDAAYATLTPDDRALGHRLAGAWLEHAGETDAIALAEHFDRGGDPARAVRWFLHGAEQALEGGDLAAAVERAERGADHRRRLAGPSAPAPERPDEMLGALLLVQAEARRWRGEFEEALRCAHDAAQHLPRGAVRWFRAAAEMMTASGRRGDFALTVAWAEQVAAERGDAGSTQDGDAAQVMALCSAGRELLHAGRYEDADALIGRVVALAGDLDQRDPRAAAELHRLRGARARQLGDLAADRAGYAAALSAFERAGDERSACNARVSLGFALIELGDFPGAGQALEEALQAAERMGLRTVATRARQNLGLVLAARGQIEEALALERRVIAEAAEQGNVQFEAWTRIYLAIIAHRAGDLAAAEAEARAALERLATLPARAGALAALSLALVGQDRPGEALAAAREAMELLVQLGGIEEFESLVRIAFAEAAGAAGDREAARAALRDGRERLLARAEAIDDDASRERFLGAVWENARLLDLARRWSSDG